MLLDSFQGGFNGIRTQQMVQSGLLSGRRNDDHDCQELEFSNVSWCLPLPKTFSAARINIYTLAMFVGFVFVF